MPGEEFFRGTKVPLFTGLFDPEVILLETLTVIAFLKAPSEFLGKLIPGGGTAESAFKVVEGFSACGELMADVIGIGQTCLSRLEGLTEGAF